MKKAKNYHFAVAVFVLPTLILFTLMVVYPVVQSAIKSFYNWNGISTPEWVGLKNYSKLFTSDIFYLANKNSFIFAGMLILVQMGLGLLLALALVTVKTKAVGFFRFSFFLPVVVASTVICQLWVSIYNPDYGLINKMLEQLGISYRQAWLTGSKSAIYAVSFVNAWQYLGIQFIMLYTGIKNIPAEYLEAARIDGASTWVSHMKITIPMLRDTLRFCLILSVTSGIKAFDTMYIMTGGGPGDYTHTLTYVMFTSAFQGNKMGYGSAVAAVIVIECILITFIINRIIPQKDM